MRRRTAAALAAALAAVAPAAAVTPADPLVSRQWYLFANHAYDAWPQLPSLGPVKIAIIDSGIDAGHPELARHLIAARSFVGGRATVDTQGHGTFVAGLIAADVGDGVGMAGSFPAAQLIVAKVVNAQRTIPVGAEARAIRWAVDEGARVINMSLGGVRDPLHPARDTYSKEEADAIAYAVRHRVVVVAAVGNGDQAPRQPWHYASYPAALPHVLGVSAFAQDGSTPPFSNRDAVFNDIAAPGEAILSTLPRQLTAPFPACAEQGYSICGPDEYRDAEGTSFAAPQVTAAAAMLLAVQPALTPDQVTTILERTATDANASNGCRRCPLGRDAFTGWGRLDVATALAALAGKLPVPDALEPNDDAGDEAWPLAWPAAGRSLRVHASVDFWDDQSDVYRVRLRRGQRLFAVLSTPKRTDMVLALWRPGTRHVDDLRAQGMRLRQSARPGLVERLSYRARRAGFYFLQVKIAAEGAGPSELELARA